MEHFFVYFLLVGFPISFSLITQLTFPFPLFNSPTPLFRFNINPFFLLHFFILFVDNEELIFMCSFSAEFFTPIKKKKIYSFYRNIDMNIYIFKFPFYN